MGNLSGEISIMVSMIMMLTTKVVVMILMNRIDGKRIIMKKSGTIMEIGVFKCVNPLKR